jgi:hypothetical protein
MMVIRRANVETKTRRDEGRVGRGKRRLLIGAAIEKDASLAGGIAVGQADLLDEKLEKEP